MTPYRDLTGMSGSPVMHGGARIAGVALLGEANMLYAVKARHAESLVSGDAGMACPQYDSLAACLEAGVRQVERMAADGDPIAI